MVVRINLLTERAEGTKPFKLSYLYLLGFFLLMVITSLYANLYGRYVLHGLRVNNIELRQQLVVVSERSVKLESRLKAVAGRRKADEEKLDYILGGVRGVEILSALAASSAGDMAVERLTADGECVVITGVAKSSAHLAAFRESLRIGGLFISIGESIITSGAGEGEEPTLFSLTCVPAAIESPGLFVLEPQTR